LQPKGKTGKTDQGLAFIQSLYRIEQTLKDKKTEEKYIIRQQQSLLILDKL
jgi:transposase